MIRDTVLARPALRPMPLLAVALAAALHLGAGGTLWWLAPPPPAERTDEPVMLLFDGAPSDRGRQEPERAGPPPESEPAAPLPQEAAAPPPRAPPDPAAAAPGLPLYEFSIPPVPTAPPPPAAREFAAPARPTTTVQRLPVSPPPRPAAPQSRPPAELPAAMPAPLPGPDAADTLAGRGRLRNDYLSRVFRHLEPYRRNQPGTLGQHGRIVTRVTLARDGRLLDVYLQTPSGNATLDAAEVAALRQASPFPAIPAGMPGDPVVLVLPINY